jgi:hypothetical protein
MPEVRRYTAIQIVALRRWRVRAPSVTLQKFLQISLKAEAPGD